MISCGGSAKIVVVGSLNIDTFLFVPALPAPGESVLAEKLLLRAGGKGFNQAIAAAKSSGDVTFIGAIGEDRFVFERVFSENNMAHIDLKGKPGPSGQAFIEVDDEGENRIIVVPGANALLSPEDLTILDELSGEQGVVVLAQNEIPEKTIEEAFRRAREHNWVTVLNAAPAKPISKMLMRLTEILVCNKSEAEFFLGLDIQDPSAIHEEVKHVLKKGPAIMIITLGRLGAFIYTEDKFIAFNSFSVDTVDTTGAGDAFCGGFVAELARTHNVEQSLIYASAAGALATTRIGASDASASHGEIIELMQSQSRH